MNLLRINICILLTLWSPIILAQQWDTAYSPSYPNAYLKLTNNEILQISNNQSYNYGDSISNIISPPTKDNYSITIANGDLYAFYKGGSSSNDSMTISIYDEKKNKWESIDYDTTLSNNTNLQYFEQSTIMTSPDKDYDSIYIYGGLYNDTISNRIIQFNPHSKTLNSIITSISPTGFYGSSNAIIDSQGVSNLLIGGKASSGWVSMFQIALWEYQSWTFKTVSSASFSVNSRVNPLVLSVFKDDETDASNVLVLGGILGNNWASPYVLNLNLTDEWNWKDVTKEAGFDVQKIMGAVVFNSTLITINNNSNKKKRSDSGYSINLYDTDTLKKVDKFDSAYQASGKASSSSSEKELSSSMSSASESSRISSSQISSASTSAASASSSAHSAASSSILAFTSSTGNSTSKGSSYTRVIVPAVVVPVVGITLLSIIAFFIYKKYFKEDEAESISDSDSDHPDFYKEVNQIDNQSISSWNQKRNEYESRRYSEQQYPQLTPTRLPLYTSNTSPIISNRTSPTQQQRSPNNRQSLDFTFDNTHIAKKFKRLSQQNKPSLQQSRSHGPFANPEDYADKQELSPMSNYANKSRVSLISSKGDTESSKSDEVIPGVGTNGSVGDEEEDQIDRFLGNRDVQVLVSSKRRSKLRITNPDLESLDSISEAGSGSTFFDEKHSRESRSNVSISKENIFVDENVENDDYVREILKAFDNDNLSTDIGSFDKYDQ